MREKSYRCDCLTCSHQQQEHFFFFFSCDKKVFWYEEITFPIQLFLLFAEMGIIFLCNKPDSCRLNI